MKSLINIINEKLKIGKTSFMLEKLKINSKSKINNDTQETLDLIKNKSVDIGLIELKDFIISLENVYNCCKYDIVIIHNTLTNTKLEISKITSTNTNVITDEDVGAWIRSSSGNKGLSTDKILDKLEELKTKNKLKYFAIASYKSFKQMKIYADNNDKAIIIEIIKR